MRILQNGQMGITGQRTKKFAVDGDFPASAFSHFSPIQHRAVVFPNVL